MKITWTILVVSTAASCVGVMSDSLVAKGIGLIGIATSTILSALQLRDASPFLRRVHEEDWEKVGVEFEIKVSKTEHRRGSTPRAKVYLEEGNELIECSTDIRYREDGMVTITASKPYRLTIEIRA